MSCLRRHHAVAQGSELLRVSETMGRVSDPAGRESHEPLDERRRWSRVGDLRQERRSRSRSSYDLLPSRDGGGVASPALNSPSIRDHSVSDSLLLLGEPAGPWRVKSMIWCDSAIVPRLARTWSRVSPPREESVASGVRNSAPGEGEDAEPLVRSTDKRSR